MSTDINDSPAAGGGQTKASPLLRMGSWLRRGRTDASGRQIFLEGGRDADAFYRRRWSHDRIARSTHGVNCTGSCSWQVYVKDGIITWESQCTDYPGTGANMPEYEPRGCPRGASFSWYEYSPTRIRYPYVRSVLLDAYREARQRLGDPVEAWADVVSDPVRSKAYRSARGTGGMVRVSWSEATEIVAAAYVHTIRAFGPDRIAGFSVIPAMSMLSYGAGSRFHELIGATMLSFYDWYADLPPASPQVFGDQTDVPESGDWFNSQYLIMWGSNVPLTRTPDAHFMVEARYHGQKVVVVSPDFADNTKFADDWLRVAPGTDGALAIAMGHVILNEFHVGRREPMFLDYMRRFSDAPFLIELEEAGARADGLPGGARALVPGKFLTADKMPAGTAERTENAAFRPLVLDVDGTVKDPGGTLADRFGAQGAGHWNLDQDGVEAVVSLMDTDDWEPAQILLPRFDLPARPGQASIGGGVVSRGVPARRINGRLVTTVYDVLLAHYAVGRGGLPGDWPTGYDDASAPGTPAWQAELTGVEAGAAVRIGREFALNAIESGGRSMILMGAGTNHYFHADTIYRTFLALTTMCATQGVNGGGWAHYVGQEKVRPITGWANYAFALDWQRPARQMIATGWYYLTTDQWRYDGARAERMASPLGAGALAGKTTADCLVESAQRGWMPSYPTFDRSPLALGDGAARAGMEPGEYVAAELAAGRLRFAAADPDAPENVPRILANWRTNLLGSSAKGTEFFLRHMLGADNDVNAAELAPGQRPATMTWREEAPAGKLDLMWTADFRNTSTTLHSDVVLPAATWYEKNDLSSTDMHPFVHPFTPAVDPPWEARTDFELYRTLAHLVSRMAVEHLGTHIDAVAAPLGHDSPDEMTTPGGIVTDREAWIPGVTMPKIAAVERDYTRIGEKYDTLGPLTEGAGMGTKGIVYHPDREVDELGDLGGRARSGAGEGRPLLDTAEKAIDAILALSGTTNGRLATQGFRTLEQRTGTRMADLSAGDEEKRITFADVVAQPRAVITSPEWSGSEHGGRRYSAFVQNMERSKPWHTLTGRPQFYVDHDWMRDMGECLPVFRPPVNLQQLYGERPVGYRGVSAEGTAEVAVRYLTIHNKWAIHSQYYDNPYMLTLGRGGQTIWMSPADAAGIGVRDNEWVEAYNRNGIVTARAVVSHRVPEGTVFMHHAQERVANTPLTERSGRRGGIHNSLTRILIKPSHLIGGYAQFSYAFNYYGPTGNQRDEVTLIRRRSQEVRF
ncbi:nitrate reductase subunit alpha [uncultured Propionibacterium sp.]|uniref:nitrate reductase subunit alpha n=1 Tax=uncultured Propionibacterium sp. TaxID=218066 RepID=UPI0029309549|nr:nitrate reductase subunit alpha [uncultured Propionibacterium sp.]